MTRINLDSIFEVLGNKTRRDILTNLSSEPMYFNQLSKKIGIGQQAILRHMKILQAKGFVQTYDEKSDLGAPDRKFFRLGSSFTLSIFSSKDEFSIKYQNLEVQKNKKAQKLHDKMSLMTNSGIAADFVHDNLTEIDQEILELEIKLHHLREMRQVLLHKSHQIGKDDFNRIEGKVFHQLVTEDPLSISSLSSDINEERKDVREALGNINKTLGKGVVFDKAEELLV